MINVKSFVSKHGRPMKTFILTLGDNIHMVILNFQKPERELLYKGTSYLVYKCRLKDRTTKGKEIQLYDNKLCLIQIPSKTALSQLYNILELQGRLDEKNIRVRIEKESNYHYKILVHADTNGK